MDASEYLDGLLSPTQEPRGSAEVETDHRAVYESLMSEPTPAIVEVEDLLAAFRPRWMLNAACRGVDRGLFFPDRGRVDPSWRAVCARCEVRTDCLGYALADTTLTGCWGGTSEPERRRMRRVA